MSQYKTFWISKDGRKIFIKDLEDKHLVNIIKYLKKNAENYREELISLGNMMLLSLHGDMAIESIESSLCQLNNISGNVFLDEYIPCYTNLITEAQKRKLIK